MDSSVLAFRAEFSEGASDNSIRCCRLQTREVVGEDYCTEAMPCHIVAMSPMRVPHGECRSVELIAIRAVACPKIPLYVLFAGSFFFEIDTLERVLVFTSNQHLFLASPYLDSV